MNKNSKYVCEKPFIYIETHIDGDITICCPAYVNNYAIGNFFEAVGQILLCIGSQNQYLDSIKEKGEDISL